MKIFYHTAKICFTLSLFFFQQAQSQTIATFNSVAPGVQSQSLVIPGSHTFQRIIKSGDALTAGGTFTTDRKISVKAAATDRHVTRKIKIIT